MANDDSHKIYCFKHISAWGFKSIINNFWDIVKVSLVILNGPFFFTIILISRVKVQFENLGTLLKSSRAIFIIIIVEHIYAVFNMFYLR
jgi:hypothetical protein